MKPDLTFWQITPQERAEILAAREAAVASMAAYLGCRHRPQRYIPPPPRGDPQGDSNWDRENARLDGDDYDWEYPSD